jgi:Tfp pilus assembly major pilin PilA
MIELIFVIVIIGILAAVAIPKLAATRDSATASTCTHEIGGLVQEVGAYYTANGWGVIDGTTKKKWSEATNISGSTTATQGFTADPTATNLSSTTAIAYKCDGKEVAKFKLEEGKLTVSPGADAGASATGIGQIVRDALKGSILKTDGSPKEFLL